MHHYFIGIVVPAYLNKKILKWKRYMHEKYGCKVGLRSPAHITLLPPFWMEEEKEPVIIDDINKISKSIEPFTIKVKNFAAFKPRTIFVDVVVDEKLQSVKKMMDEYFSQRDYKLKTDTRPFHPHVTIATRDLHKKDFREAWEFFAKKKFDGEWEAEGISLLKHNSVQWEVVYCATFG